MKQQQVVSLDKLATLLGKSRHYVLDRLSAGLPYVDKGGRSIAYTFDPAAARAWCAEYDANLDTTRKPDPARQRYVLAQAELKELQLAQRRGELVKISDVTAVLADELVTVRQRLLAMPGRLAMMLVGKDAAAIEAAIYAAANPYAAGDLRSTLWRILKLRDRDIGKRQIERILRHPGGSNVAEGRVKPGA